jgi:hypothetical protein
MIDVGLLEFRDNGFMQSILAGLAGTATEFICAGQLIHPTPSPSRVIVDRVSFCDPFLRQLMRYWSLGGAYVLNNPFFTLVFDKLSELLYYDRLAIPHPRTVLLPRPNRDEDMREIVREPDWSALEEQVGFPCILKPVDGYAWQDVFRVDDQATLHSLYETLKNKRTLIVQQLVPYSDYYRAFCVNRSEVFVVRWKPQPFDRGEYSVAAEGTLGSAGDFIREKTIALNAAFGLDFNTVEWCIARDGAPTIIDSYNDVPDVRREKLPPACYDWVVDRLCACIREKVRSGERNTLGGLPPGSEPGPAPR